MRRMITVGAVVLLGAGLSACATKGQLRQLEATQRAALEGERSQRLAAESELRNALQSTTEDVAALRRDLDQLRDEFGAQISMLEGRLQFAMPVHFDFDDAEVRSADHAALDRFVEVVQAHYQGSYVTVEGFADPAGSTAYNRRLSERRAQAVEAYLLQRGLEDERLRTVGYGEERQVVPGAAARTPGAELNRRVVFVIEGPVREALPGTPVGTEAT